jgi:hypothetical protein
MTTTSGANPLQTHHRGGVVARPNAAVGTTPGGIRSLKKLDPSTTPGSIRKNFFLEGSNNQRSDDATRR